MAKLPLSLASPRPYKTKGNPFSGQPNGISFWAFLVSIFIYISIFYIFNLSPSTLFATPKFWFFICNTLVLIIAADSGAFSSSKQNHSDSYYEYLPSTAARNSPSPSLEIVEKNIPAVLEFRNSPSPSPEIVEKNIPAVLEFRNCPSSSLEIVEKNFEVENLVEKNVVVHETKLEIVLRNDTDKPNEFTPEDSRRILRSKSDKVISEKPKDEENKVVLRRSETEKLQPKDAAAAADENDEFSSMSDEELNRRIEEFIQKFNRQIRASREYQ